jgi:Uracil DNA glycosylase superfamily
MSDPAFKRSQEDGRWLPPVAAINALVDALHQETGQWLPHVAPIYGGLDAEMLMIARDPGPGTNPTSRGSGFLCLENDDGSAELRAWLLDELGIDANRVTAWNAYPWYINRKPKAAELDDGVEPLRRLLALLGRVRIVMLNGGEAKTGWKKFRTKYPQLAERYAVLPTYHTSKQAFIGTAEIRAERLADLRAKHDEALQLLGDVTLA